mmetsp:Transcript_15601/g.11355  ORF Transcript_15601/g.11355 Transcript_15601/m.11355 type:complete len:100 (-) Transcript_15601:141-440(-)|eukprot:CAMPEP_0202961310 /NCGR_PEP_ID=MMETSP1396-20130829/5362_1 /ASSEMBLY_ACC=CAM_ASM_000872 /TAXON_ID= /ORGANISM="Pseudokeronopsis sp., Strain Brazil" /LENGTH=99 /DNA_ID=CAMNT_0049681029 /DNA_START=155 /DNA_END=454 /DNA_ORIENTATION=+
MFSTGGADDKESDEDFKSKSKTEGQTDDETLAQIKEWIENNDVVIFMKGNKKMPRCGFSKYVVEVMKFYGIKEYKDVDVLQDEKIRATIKTYSNWPTIP